MSVTPREVRNKRGADGKLTGKPGTVYDVNVTYRNTDGKRTSYQKRGFATKQEATMHDAEMYAKLNTPGMKAQQIKESKQLVSQYLREWLESYGTTNLTPNTCRGYKVNIEKHIIPSLGNIKLVNLCAADMDNLYAKLAVPKEQGGTGLSSSSIRYIHRTMSIALEHARKYELIKDNPARNIFTKFTSVAETPDPYTVEQVQTLMYKSQNTDWEFIIVLAGLYGLRRGEVLGLSRDCIDLDKKLFHVKRQLDSRYSSDRSKLFAPLKELASDRVLPITAETLPYFERHLQYLDGRRAVTPPPPGDLLFYRENGEIYNQSHLSRGFNEFLKHCGLPHLRFHDLRHTAATNMHELTGDYYTVGKILGHSLKGVSERLGVDGVGKTMTQRYIDVRTNRMNTVLSTYHKAVQPRKPKGKSRPELER